MDNNFYDGSNNNSIENNNSFGDNSFTDSNYQSYTNTNNSFDSSLYNGYAGNIELNIDSGNFISNNSNVVYEYIGKGILGNKETIMILIKERNNDN